MQPIIRIGTREDIPQVLNLIKQLALFEKAPEQVITNAAQMINDGFGDNPCYKLLVAEVEKKIEGIAIFFIKYSTWKGKGIYLDDIVVNEQMRGKGIGKKLFDAEIGVLNAVVYCQNDFGLGAFDPF